MAERWERQLMDFLKRAGDDLKRTGDELRRETQRMLDEVRDPARQAKVKESLQDFTHWARQTGKDAATLVETAVHKVESALERGPIKKAQKASGAPQAARPSARKGSTAKAARAPSKKAPARPRAKTTRKAAARPRKPSQP